jgi:hypothetical protein
LTTIHPDCTASAIYKVMSMPGENFVSTTQTYCGILNNHSAITFSCTATMCLHLLWKL